MDNIKTLMPGVQHTLINDTVEVFLLPRPNDEIITFRCMFDWGIVDDPRTTIGITALLHRLNQRKTKDFASQYDLMAKLEGLGGLYDSNVSKEGHSFSLQFTDITVFPKILELLTQIIYYPEFTQELINQEVHLMKQEYLQTKSTPQAWVQMQALPILFPKSAYGFSSSFGDLSALESISVDDLVDHQATLRSQTKLVVGVSGNFEVDAVLKTLSTFDVFTSVDAFRTRVKPETNQATRVVVDERAIEQLNLFISYPTVGQLDELYWAQKLFDYIIGKGLLSRMYSIRTEHSLAYYFGSSYQSYQNMGILSLVGGVPADNFERVLHVVREQLRDVAENGFTSQERKRGMNYVCGSYARELEVGSTELAFTYGTYAAYGKAFSFDEWKQRLSSVTDDALKEVAERLYRSNDVVISAVGPIEQEKVEEMWRSAREE